MNSDTLTNLAASQAAFKTAQAEVKRAALRVFKAAAKFKDSRPNEERWPIKDHFGEWNSERNHIFWAETDFYNAQIEGDQVALKTGYSLRSETTTFWLYFPVEWLTLDDAALNTVLTDEWNKLLQEAQNAAKEKERRATWERYQTYLQLKEEFDGQPAPEKP